MKKDDPVETMTVKNESGWRVYDVPLSQLPRLRAEELVGDTIESLECRGRNIKRTLTPKKYDKLFEILVGITEARLALPES